MRILRPRTRIYIREKGSSEWSVFRTQQQVADAIGISRPMINYYLYTDKIGKHSFLNKYEMLTEKEYIDGNHHLKG